MCVLGDTASSPEHVHRHLLLILDIYLIVDTGGVQVPVVTQQANHLSSTARNPVALTYFQGPW